MDVEIGKQYFLKTYTPKGAERDIKDWMLATAVEANNEFGYTFVDQRGLFWGEWAGDNNTFVPYEEVVK